MPETLQPRAARAARRGLQVHRHAERRDRAALVSAGGAQRLHAGERPAIAEFLQRIGRRKLIMPTYEALVQTEPTASRSPRKCSRRRSRATTRSPPARCRRRSTKPSRQPRGAAADGTTPRCSRAPDDAGGRFRRSPQQRIAAAGAARGLIAACRWKTALARGRRPGGRVASRSASIAMVARSVRAGARRIHAPAHRARPAAPGSVIIDGQRWVYVERAADARRCADHRHAARLHRQQGELVSPRRATRRPLPAGHSRSARLGREPAHGAMRITAIAAQAAQRRGLHPPGQRPARSCCSAIRWAAASPRSWRRAIPREVARVGLLDAAGVRFKDNQFGLDVLAGQQSVRRRATRASLERYLDILFHRSPARGRGSRGRRRAIADRAAPRRWRIRAVRARPHRPQRRALPARRRWRARIAQPALLLWCRQDAVIDASAMDLFAAQMPQAQQDAAGGLRPHVADGTTRCVSPLR